MRKKRPLILVTNDDGVYAKGIVTLAGKLRSLGRVVIVAPNSERSAASHSVTLHRPLRVDKIANDTYAVDGTPTDCIMLAVHGIFKKRPDLIVSGINHGANLGDDVHYSGTVSAAVEGAILGIPAIAISQIPNGKEWGFKTAATFAFKVAKKVLKEGLSKGVILNINIPSISPSKIKGYKFTSQGKRNYQDIIIEKLDPRGRKYYWIGGDVPNFEDIAKSDCNAVLSGWISITPLRVNLTDNEVLIQLEQWRL